MTVRTTDGVTRPLSGETVVTRGQGRTVVYEDERAGGVPIQDEVESMLMSCAARD